VAKDDDKAHAAIADWRSAPLTERERAIAELAQGLTLAVSRPPDLDALRAVGLDDRALLDVVQVVAYFNFVNRLVAGLGVEIEPRRRP